MARNRLVWLVCLAILSVLPAGATFDTYATLAEWQVAATQSGATIDFSSFAPNLGGYLYTTSLYVEPVTFTSPPNLNMQVTYSTNSAYQWGSTAILCAYADYPLMVTLATPVTAFAARTGIYNGTAGSQMTITVTSGSTTTTLPSLATVAHPTLTFFGVVSTTPGETIDSITFTPPEGKVPFLDDVRVGAYQAPVPEMGTGALSLCGGMLLAAGAFRKRGRPL
jgi:hypothetical protein